jgi:hypothetical protein
MSFKTRKSTRELFNVPDILVEGLEPVFVAVVRLAVEVRVVPDPFAVAVDVELDTLPPLATLVAQVPPSINPM